MPWLEKDPMIERLKFVRDALSDRFTMDDVCARYGVSRPTGYKWIARLRRRAGVGSPTGAVRLSLSRTRTRRP